MSGLVAKKVIFLFQIRFQNILSRRAKMYWNLDLKNPGLVPFVANLAYFRPKSNISARGSLYNGQYWLSWRRSPRREMWRHVSVSSHPGPYGVYREHTQVYTFVSVSKRNCVRPCALLMSHNTQQVNHIKGNITLVLMHSGIVNGYQLLCNAHTVLEPQRGTAAFFLFVSLLLLSFYAFSFYVFVTLDSPYFFSWVPL